MFGFHVAGGPLSQRFDDGAEIVDDNAYVSVLREIAGLESTSRVPVTIL
jgi:hypothetical protein